MSRHAVPLAADRHAPAGVMAPETRELEAIERRVLREHQENGRK